MQDDVLNADSFTLPGRASGAGRNSEVTLRVQ
jgi:hypothetical protein